MKKYKINMAYPVNARYGKKGFRWEYRGKKTEQEAQEIKESFERNIIEPKQLFIVGLKITDTETGTVIYEKTI